ncbi:MAG TPA: Asd/ArgC dimerization domain-containing protein [Myxococcota bacterium]|nr:Asd/ArgC dimerization domain-containing protein [Myxococcota bacterium]
MSGPAAPPRSAKPGGLRVAVVGATGALGSEVLAAIDAARLPVAALLPIGTDRSLGAEIEFGGRSAPVLTDASALEGADVVFVCTPAAAALDWIAEAVRRRVLAIDLSGALYASESLAASPELARLLDTPDAPLVAPPPGPALAWLRVLAPLHQGLAGVQRVVGTALVSASGSGRAGVEALHAETVALLSQSGDDDDLPALDHPIAFDVLPWAGTIGDDGASEAERALAASLRRGLGAEAALAVSVARVPTFCGDAASLAIECGAPAEPARVRELLRKARDVELVDDPRGPTTRGAAGLERVLVGRVRRDPSRPGAVLLWLAADSARLAAADAVRTAIGRLGLP